MSATDNNGEGDAIRVFLRVRPPDTTNSALPCGTLVLDVDTAKSSITLLAKPDPKVFTFDYVADSSCTQESVFSAVCKSLIESCVAGYNGTIFAYGQTGSGKTFTMLGPSEESDSFKHELRGVIPRSFEHLFNLVAREQDLHGEKKQFLCKCSFLEIYQEQVYDLLDPAAANLLLRENIKKGVFVDGLMEQVVATPNEAYQALSVGWLNRRVGATSMNRESSRSHAVFTLIIESKQEKNGVTNVRQSQLNLVDLAGSERQKDTNTVGIRLKEAGKINKSLSVLGNVIMSLVDIAHGRTRHVPYRDSKLTFLLRDSLGGNAHTSIVACVHPDARCFGETLSTLNFAKRAKMIKNKAVINEDMQGNVAHLQTEIRRLRDMLVQFQTGNIPPALPSGTVVMETSAGSPSAQDASSWRQKFLEAMLFWEKSEQEKEVLRQRLCGLEEEGRKKDRMLQSSRMVIKFRENRIALLEKNVKGADNEPLVGSVNNKLEDDLVAIKQQLDQYPQVARLDHELHNLQAQLADARIRLSATTATVLDANRLLQLEQVFRDLQSGKRRESSLVSPSRIGERSCAVSTQKLKDKLEAVEDECKKLKQQLVEERQVWETKEVGLQAELTAANKMTKDLERVLEVNHLKHRIERDALTSLHCHTLKVITTPTRTSYDLRNRTEVVGAAVERSDALDTTLEMDEGMEDICQEGPPDVMVDMTHQALTDEIRTLQESNSSLQERINEYEADMLRLQQQIGQLDLKNASLNEMLTKERHENCQRQAEHEQCIHELQEQMENLTADLTYARDESKDLKILLQASDRELKEEREKTKSCSAANDQRINVLETQLLQVKSILETVTNDLEIQMKDKEQIAELLDTQHLEVAFLEEHSAKLEAALQQETAEHQATSAKLEEMKQQLQSERQHGKQQREKVAEVSLLKQRVDETMKEMDETQSHLEAVEAELAAAKVSIGELRRDVADSQEAMQQQVGRVQELRSKLTAMQDEQDVLKELAETRAVEVNSMQQLCETQHKQLNAKDEELSKLSVQVEMLREDLNYYQEQNDKMVQECEQHDSVRQQLETVQNEKNLLAAEVARLKEELAEREARLQQITQYLEQASSQQAPPTSPDKSMDLTLAREKKLCVMIEELQVSWRQCSEENQQLKTELVVMKQKMSDKVAVTLQCQELQHRLDNQEAVYKESMKQLQEVAETERLEVLMLRKSLTEAQRQQDASGQEKQLLLSQLEEAEKERVLAEDERDRLKSILGKSYTQEDQLSSQIEVLKEENKRLQEELVALERHRQQLADDNAALAGHTNHLQKVSYLKRLQLDYNELKGKYDEVVKENQSLTAHILVSPLRDRTNLSSLHPHTELVDKKLPHV